MTSFSERKKRRKGTICYSNEKYVGQNSDFVSGEHDNIKDNTILMILENDVIL